MKLPEAGCGYCRTKTYGAVGDLRGVASVPFTGLTGSHALVINIRWSLAATVADRVRDIFLPARGYLITFHMLTCSQKQQRRPHHDMFHDMLNFHCDVSSGR